MMDGNYIFLMTNNSRGAVTTETAKCILHDKEQSADGGFPWSAGVPAVKASQVCLCCDPDNDHQPPDIKWIDTTTGSDVFDEYLHHSCPDQLVDQGRTAGLSDHLHELANDLPENGAFLDILWPFDIVKHLVLSDHTALFGALKRLVEWHDAFLHVIVTSDAVPVTEQVQEWLDLLRASVVTLDQLHAQLNSRLWRGQVNITGTKDTRALRLPHFCLSTYHKSRTPTPRTRLNVRHPHPHTDTHSGLVHGAPSHDDKGHVTAGSLELVSAVRRSHVSSLYVTHHVYSLSVPSSSRHVCKSKLFLQKLEKDRKAAYVLRLRHGTRWKLAPPSDKDRNHPRQYEWKERVRENIAYVTDHQQSGEVEGDAGSRQLLVWFQPGPDGGDFVACLLRRPEDFSGHVAMTLAKEELLSEIRVNGSVISDHTDHEVETLLAGLPHYRADDFLTLAASAETIQVAALKEWLAPRGGGAELSVSELLAVLRTAKHLTWQKLEASGIYSSQRPAKRHRVMPIRPEYELDVMSQWEGVSLNLREMAAGVQLLKRQSDDSLGGLAPPTGQVVTLNASEFLKHFNEDGTATRADRAVVRPLRSPSRRFCKYNSGDIKKSEWPDCLRARDHDIYYNCEERDALELQCERMRSRLLASETASTCTLQQARCPATITIHDPASRDSPQHDAGTDTGHAPTRASATDTGHAPTRDRPDRPAKRKPPPDDRLTSDSKRLLGERKKVQEEKLRAASHRQDERQNADKTAAGTSKTSLAESRSQRHKRKLQEVVIQTLVKRGVAKGDPIYTACVNKLYTLTKCFVKDLKTSHNLRQEMEKIAESHVEQVIEFERRIKS